MAIAPVRIELPTPFAVATVNVYLLPGPPLTLVDAGPRTPETLAALESALAGHDARVDDVELLVLTHHHIDHAGLAATVYERSGCEIAAHAIAADLLSDLDATRDAQDTWAAALLRLHGAPEPVIETVTEVSHRAAPLCEPVEVGRRLESGDVLSAGGAEFDVLLRPGHSPSDTLFVAGDGWALVGDHVLAHGASVTLAELPPGADPDPRSRPRPLLDYRASLAATAALELETAYAGHGPTVSGPSEVIAARLAAHERRASHLRAELEDGPRTVWELVSSRPGGAAVGGPPGWHPIGEAFVVFSNVVAHLDLLVAEGRAREVVRDDGCIAFEAAALGRERT